MFESFEMTASKNCPDENDGVAKSLFLSRAAIYRGNSIVAKW